jgi:hypothetical protein
MQEKEEKKEKVKLVDFGSGNGATLAESKAEPTISDVMTILQDGFDTLEDVLRDMHNSLTIIERKLSGD